MSGLANRLGLIVALVVSPFALWLVLGWRALFGWLIGVGIIAALFFLGHESKHGGHSAADDLV